MHFAWTQSRVHSLFDALITKSKIYFINCLDGNEEEKKVEISSSDSDEPDDSDEEKQKVEKKKREKIKSLLKEKHPPPIHI
jgi:hypothetical protein